MGAIGDMNDVSRVMRSREGEAYLEEIRQMLKGRTITEVSFENETHYIATILHLDDGEDFFITQSSLDVDALREQFADVIEREYQIDYPERKPSISPAE